MSHYGLVTKLNRVSIYITTFVTEMQLEQVLSPLGYWIIQSVRLGYEDKYTRRKCIIFKTQSLPSVTYLRHSLYT